MVVNPLRGLYENLDRVVPCGLGPFGSDFHRIQLACEETAAGVLPDALEKMRIRATELVGPRGRETTFDDRSRNMTDAERDELRAIVQRLHAFAEASIETT